MTLPEGRGGEETREEMCDAPPALKGAAELPGRLRHERPRPVPLQRPGEPHAGLGVCPPLEQGKRQWDPSQGSGVCSAAGDVPLPC